MRKLQFVALGVLIGFALSAALGGLRNAGAQMNGPTPAEAKKALAQEKAILDQIGAQWEQMQRDMNATAQMPMTSTEQSMMKMIKDQGAMIHGLWQSQNQLYLLMTYGAHNK